MDVIVRLEGVVADELRSLRAWLAEEDELRGRLRLAERPPRPGELGPALDTLLIALGPGGAASVLVAGLIAWVRSRHGDIEITAERAEDRTTIRVSAKRVRGLDADGLRDEIDRLGHALSNGLPPGGAGSGSPAQARPVPPGSADGRIVGGMPQQLAGTGRVPGDDDAPANPTRSSPTPPP